MTFAWATRTASILASAALVAGAALLSPTTAHAATAGVGSVKIGGVPSSGTVPYGGAQTVPAYIAATVTFTGPAADPDDSNRDGISIRYTTYDQNNNGASVATVSSRVKNPAKPTIYSVPNQADVLPGAVLRYVVRVTNYTSPGTYKLAVPIGQSVYDSKTGATTRTSKVGYATFTVKANVNESLYNTRTSMYGYLNVKYKWQVSVWAPDYQRGASVKVYYQAKGKKKYTKIGSSTLNGTGDKSFKTKKVTIKKSGKLYIQIGAVSNAPGYKVTQKWS